MRWPARVRRVGDGEGLGFGGFVAEPCGDEQDERRERGEDVVLLPGGEARRRGAGRRPRCRGAGGCFRRREGADGDERAQGFAPGDGGEGVEEVGAPGHQPDEEESPEEAERDGVVVAGDAEVEVAEDLLVDEVEPEPAVDVAVGGQGTDQWPWVKVRWPGWPWVGLARAMRMCQGAAMARKTMSAGDGVELADAGEGAAKRRG